MPAVLADSPLNTPDADAFAGAAWCRARVACDAPVDGPRGEWLLDHLGGDFTLLTFGAVPATDVALLTSARIPAACCT